MPSRDTPLSTRASRSRFSSPAIAHSASDAASKSNGTNGAGKQTALDAWLEPPMSKDPPLPNMQPLGTMPKSSALKKFEPTSISRQPKIIFKKSVPASNTARSTPVPEAVAAESKEGEGEGEEVDATTLPAPAHVPASSRTTSPLRSIVDTPASTARPTIDEDIFSGVINNPLPQNPLAQTSQSQTQTSPAPLHYFPSLPRKSLPRGAPVREYPSPQHQPRVFSQPVHPSFPHQSPASPLPATPASGLAQSPSSYLSRPLSQTQTTRSLPHSITPSFLNANPRIHFTGHQIPHSYQVLNPHLDFDDMDDDVETFARNVVETAVTLALDHHRYASAYMLLTLYDENSHDEQFMDTLEDYFRQTGDPESVKMKSLYMLMFERKKKGRKNNTAFQFFKDAGRIKEDAPQPPKQADSSLVRLDFSANKQQLLGNKQEWHLGDLRNRPGQESFASRGLDTRILKNPRPDESFASDEMLAHALNMSKQENESRSQTAAANPRHIAETVEDDASAQPRKRIKTVSSSAQSTPVAALDAAPVAQPPATIPKLKTPKRANGINGSAHNTPPRRGRVARGNSEDSMSSLSTARSVSLPAEEQDNRQASATKRRRAAGKKDSDTDIDEIMEDADTPPAFEVKHFPPAHGSLDPDDPKVLARKAARGATDKVLPPSAFRPDVAAACPQQDVEIIEAPTALEKKRPTRAVAQRSTRANAKRGAEDITDDASPTSGQFPAPESSMASRATTPGPKAKKAKTGLRVKNSPMKKKTGPSAGVPRPSGERGSPAESGAAIRQDENDDYCASCGGSGELLCCDGCPRALHFLCVDPPITSEPEEFFCNVCSSERLLAPPAPDKLVGPFAILMDSLESKNSSAFRLPRAVQDLFEGVKASSTGEYEDIVPPAPKSGKQAAAKKKTVDQEFEEYHRIVDSQDKPIVCHACSKPADNDTIIIGCTVCPTYWHLECASDVPITHPPPIKTWKCPLHIPMLKGVFPGGGAHKQRAIKNALPVKPAYGRNLVNNGTIEIVDDDDPMPPNLSGWNDGSTFGRVHQVSVTGVRKDFSEGVSKRRWRKTSSPLRILKSRPHVAKAALDVAIASSSAPAPVAFVDDHLPINRAQAEQVVTPAPGAVLQDRRPIDRVQAEQVVTSLSSSSGVGHLVNALLQGGDDQYIALVAQANPMTVENSTFLSVSDRTALQAIRARINQLLAQSPAIEAPAAAPVAATAVENAPAAEAGAVSDEETVAADQNGDREAQGNDDVIMVDAPNEQPVNLELSHKTSATTDAAPIEIESDHVKTEASDDKDGHISHHLN